MAEKEEFPVYEINENYSPNIDQSFYKSNKRSAIAQDQ